MEKLPFTDSSFDIVFCNAVLHHTKDLERVLRELRRGLAPDGRILVVSEPDYGLLDKKVRKKKTSSKRSVGASTKTFTVIAT